MKIQKINEWLDTVNEAKAKFKPITDYPKTEMKYFGKQPTEKLRKKISKDGSAALWRLDEVYLTKHLTAGELERKVSSMSSVKTELVGERDKLIEGAALFYDTSEGLWTILPKFVGDEYIDFDTVLESTETDYLEGNEKFEQYMGEILKMWDAVKKLK